MKLTIRSLAWFAIAAQPLSVAAWLVAGALQPHYSHADSGVSALAAHGARHPGVAMAAMVLLGLSAAALAPGLLAVLPRRRAARVAAGLLVVVAAGFVVAALARLDCDISLAACNARELSWRTDLHEWAGLVTSVALVGSAFALARALWPSVTAALALDAGLIGIGLGVIAAALYRGTDAPDGLVERGQLLAAQAWLVIVAVGVLHETRPAPRLSASIPLRPRDFFGAAWTGEGQLWAWGLGGPRFTLSRTTTWTSGDVGIVRDRAVFEGGRVEERVRFAHLVSPTRIHVSGDDMPDGADVTVDEDGYRMAPYRVLVPVGPLRFIVSCRDEGRLEDDGTLRYVVRVAWHGLPVAEVAMRARPVDTAPAPEDATALSGSR